MPSMYALGLQPMPKPEQMTDALYALCYRMSREEVEIGRIAKAKNIKLRNASGQPRKRKVSLVRAKARRMDQGDRKAVIKVVVAILSDPQAMALIDNLDALYKYLDGKLK
jgi:hypothetical protein